MKFKIFLFVIITLATSASKGSDDHVSVYLELQNLKETVLKEPLKAIQILDKYDSQLFIQEPSIYFLWHLRKIQALNYSYRFTAFEQQLNSVLGQMNDKTPPEVKAYLLMYQGIQLQRNGNYSGSIEALRESISISESNEFNAVRTKALVELTYSLSLAEQYELAMIELQQAYQLANKLQDSFLSGLVEESNAALLGYREEYENSLERYLIAERHYRTLNYPYYLGESAYGLASTYRYSQEYDLAIEWYNKYYDAVKHFNTEYTEFFYYYGLGMTYSSMNDCTNALAAINRVLTITQFKDYKAELLKRMAVCLAKIEDFVAAETALHEAELIYDSIPELAGTSWQLETIKVSAKIADLQGDKSKAYQLISDYYEKLIEVEKNNASQRLDKLRLAVIDERRKHELTVLENTSKLQASQLQIQTRKNEIQKLWLLGLVALSLIVLGILIWQISINRKIRDLAIIDDLTGLYNRRYIFSAIDSVLRKQTSGDIFNTVMLIDIDNLKPINDRFGHQVGDRVIQTVAQVGQNVIRDGDIMARIGGDEFMLFLSRTEEERNEVTIANRLRETILAAPIEWEGSDKIDVSISIGVTSIKQRNDSLKQIYSRVDKALYEAKRSESSKIVNG